MYIPLFLIGLTFISTLLLISMTGETFAYSFVLISLFFIIVLIAFYKLSKRMRRPVKTILLVVLSALVAGSMFIIKEEVVYEPTTRLCSNTAVTVCARVTKIYGKSGKGPSKYTVDVYDMKDSKGNTIKIPFYGLKILVTSNDLKCSLGDNVNFKSKLTVVGDKNKQIRNYYKAQGIYIGAYSYKVACTSEIKDTNLKFIMLQFSDKVNKLVRKSFYRYLPDDYANIALGMLTGDKSSMDEEYSELFKKVGVIHLFSVSGFHVSLFSMLIFRELLKKKCNLKTSSVFTIIFILIFCLITGFSKSTIRASIMLIVFFLGRMMTKDADSRSSLGLSALIILTINPYSGGDFGFLLSFFATLGILSASKQLMRPIKLHLKKIGDIILREKIGNAIGTFVVSVCAFVSTLPLLVLFTDSVALVSPISNLFITFAAETAILFSGLGLVLSLIPFMRIFCYPVFFIVGQCIKYILISSNLISRLPYYNVNVSEDGLNVVLAAVMILFAFAFLLPLHNSTTFERTKFTFLLSVTLIMGTVFFNLLSYY